MEKPNSVPGVADVDSSTIVRLWCIYLIPQYPANDPIEVLITKRIGKWKPTLLARKIHRPMVFNDLGTAKKMAKTLNSEHCKPSIREMLLMPNARTEIP